MPNIEIYGFATNFICSHAVHELRLRQDISNALLGAAYFGEVVFTTVESQVTNVRRGSSQKRLRIWSDRQDELDDIAWRLGQLDIGIEVAPLLTRSIEPRSVRLQRMVKTDELAENIRSGLV